MPHRRLEDRLNGRLASAARIRFNLTVQRADFINTVSTKLGLHR